MPRYFIAGINTLRRRYSSAITCSARLRHFWENSYMVTRHRYCGPLCPFLLEHWFRCLLQEWRQRQDSPNSCDQIAVRLGHKLCKRLLSFHAHTTRRVAWRHQSSQLSFFCQRQARNDAIPPDSLIQLTHRVAHQCFIWRRAIEANYSFTSRSRMADCPLRPRLCWH